MLISLSQNRWGSLSMKIVRKAGRWFSSICAVIGFVFVLVTVTPLVSWWAQAYSGPIGRPKGDVLILLSAADDDRGGISFSSYWRAREAIYAFQTGGFKKIVVTGGGGPSILEYMIAEGIPREAVVAEWRSTSTRESGIAMARLMQTMPGKKVLLTSDFHMYRALRVFRKLHVDVTPMAVRDVLQSSAGWGGRFGAFETMVGESAKIVYYFLRGWI
jgi:uncharacterized SAM-binding protein YcdF (DUF218 family)